MFDRAEPFPAFFADNAPGFVNQPGSRQFSFDFCFGGAIEHWSNGAESQAACSPTEFGFEHLADVHTTGDAKGIEDDVHRGSILEEGHVFNWQHHRDAAFVSMPSSHFVASGDLTALRHGDAHHFIDASRKIAVFFTSEDFHVHHDTAFAVGHAQGGVFYVA